MNKDQFKNLCKECDKFLTFNPRLIYIPYLHVLREHPFSILRYKTLFNTFSFGSYFLDLFNLILKFSKSIAGQLGRVSSSIFKPNQFWYSNEDTSNVDVLFISHLISKDEINTNDDFYFSSIPKVCKNAGIDVALVLIDHVELTHKNILKKFKGEIPVFLLPHNGPLLLEIKILWQIVKLSMNVFKYQEKLNNLSKRILRTTFVEAFSGATCSAIRLEYQLDKIVEKTLPQKIVMTWEGHAWERILVALAKKKNINIETIGYQHSIISKFQHSACRSLGNEFDPDRLWVSDKKAYKRFVASKLRPKLGISIVGSNKVHNTLSRVKSIAYSKKKYPCILVTPEGIESECSILFNFSIKCAKLYPKLNFIWRLHPTIKFQKLFKKFKHLEYRPSTVIISNKNFDQDILQSSHILYRGSTSVIKAVACGLQPIYLNLPGEMSIDPIHELKEWKLTVKKPNDFVISNNYNNSIKKQKEFAINYARSFYCPISNKAILETMKNIKKIT